MRNADAGAKPNAALTAYVTLSLIWIGTACRTRTKLTSATCAASTISDIGINHVKLISHMKKQNLKRAAELDYQLMIMEAAEKVLRKDQDCKVVLQDVKGVLPDVVLPHSFVYDLLIKVKAQINVINNEIETL